MKRETAEMLIRAILTQAGKDEKASMVRFLEGQRQAADPASDRFENGQRSARNAAIDEAIVMVQSGGLFE